MDKRFAGKYAFQSVNTEGEKKYVTLIVRNGIFLPVVSGTEIGNAKCIVYQNGEDGTEKIILLEDSTARLIYLTLQPELGMIYGSFKEEDAKAFHIISLADDTTQFELMLDDVWLPVQYTVNTLLPYLIVPLGTGSTESADTLTEFAQIEITPDLATIIKTKNARGYDFSKIEFTNVDFSGIDFSGADFSDAHLTNINFTGACLKNTIFTNVALDAVDFTNAALDGADFSGGDLRQVTWGMGVSAQGTNFSNCSLQGCKIGNSKQPINFINANCSNADFSHADLRQVDFTNTSFYGGNLSYCNLEGANFTSARLGGMDNMPAAKMAYTYIANTNFNKANLFGVSFVFSTIRGDVSMNETSTMEQSDFSNAYLSGVNLTGAYLRGAKFTNACLVNANLSSANLEPANKGSLSSSFVHACLQGVNFSSSVLNAVDFTNAAVALQDGSIDIRFSDVNGQPIPPPPYYMPVNYTKTLGLDYSTIKPDTICPNGCRFDQNPSLPLDQLLVSAEAPTKWVPIGMSEK